MNRHQGLATVLLGALSFGVGCAVTGLVIWMAALAVAPDAAARGSWWGELAMATYQVIITAALNTLAFLVPAAPCWIVRSTRPARAVVAGVLSGAAATLLQWTGLWALPIRLLDEALGRGIAVWIGFASPGLVTGLAVGVWVLLWPDPAEPR